MTWRTTGMENKQLLDEYYKKTTTITFKLN